MDGMSGGHGGYESPPQTCPGSNARTPRQSHDGGHGAGAAAAREQYQDEMIELEEREETDAHKALLEKEAAAREATYVEANVSGISELFERMMRDDPEYAKLKARPGSSFTPVPIRPR